MSLGIARAEQALWPVVSQTYSTCNFVAVERRSSGSTISWFPDRNLSDQNKDMLGSLTEKQNYADWIASTVTVVICTPHE